MSVSIRAGKPQDTPFWVAPPPELAALMALQYSIGSNDIRDVTDLVQALLDSDPANEFGPHTKTDGVEAFLDYEGEMDDDDCANMIQEIKVLCLCIYNSSNRS
jgi:hypothetical protein